MWAHISMWSEEGHKNKLKRKIAVRIDIIHTLSFSETLQSGLGVEDWLGGQSRLKRN